MTSQNWPSELPNMDLIKTSNDIDFYINNFTALSVEILRDVQLSMTYSDFFF